MLLSLLGNDGLSLKRKTSNGGEFAGPCPWCGGTDRFIVWPKKGDTGRYWCRRCGKKGDGIQYLRDFHKMNYKNACVSLNLMPKIRFNPGRSGAKTQASWKPKKMRVPPLIWRQKAGSFVRWSQEKLWSREGERIQKWLYKDRGISEKTIRASEIGYCPYDIWRPRSAWGIEENGKKLWLPKGLLIPYRVDNRLVRVRIRRFKGQKPRYYLLPGSSTVPMVLHSRPGLPVLIVESELDAILTFQKAHSIVNVMALGAAQIRPDTAVHRILEKTPEILVALDSDSAGIGQAWNWWKKQYGDKWERLPPVMGKDPCEMYRAGVNLLDWVRAGIMCGKDD